MALLDLQGMEAPRQPNNGHSGASKDCASFLSLILC